ncbi:hypothetical protein OIU79_025323 [Salix purpurea]|uniref:Uncharacterized protein n=1 Tax=Salix purpurea TaxID=77065 RepID=A0A9Q1A766_SALPP|nr:hypothetical protein OIU79_025323 [Salix purpurea]
MGRREKGAFGKWGLGKEVKVVVEEKKKRMESAVRKRSGRVVVVVWGVMCIWCGGGGGGMTIMNYYDVCVAVRKAQQHQDNVAPFHQYRSICKVAGSLLQLCSRLFYKSCCV